MNKNLVLNFLSLFNVVMGFLFTLLIGRFFGVSSETDMYFASIIFINYISYIIMILWEGFTPYYADIKVKDKKESDKLFSVLLNRVLIGSIILYGFIQLFIPLISEFLFDSQIAEQYLNIFSIYIVFYNLNLLLKSFLNINSYFSIPYYGDLFLNTVNLIILFFLHDQYGIMSIAYGYVITSFLLVLVQLSIVLFKMKIKLYFKVKNPIASEIIKGSVLLKLGSFFYGGKDIVISKVLLVAGDGVYSIFSYSSKFASAIHLIVNAPVINIFATKVTFMVSEGKFSDMPELIKGVLRKLILLFVPAVSITFIMIPYFLKFFMEFDSNIALDIRNNFLLLSLFYLVVVFEAPYSRSIPAFKRFDIILNINITFFIAFSLLVVILPKTIFFVICNMIIAQIFNFIQFKNNLRKLLKESD